MVLPQQPLADLSRDSIATSVMLTEKSTATRGVRERNFYGEVDTPGSLCQRGLEEVLRRTPLSPSLRARVDRLPR